MAMRYAIIENGIVVNVALSDYPLAENWIEDAENVAQIGGSYDGVFQAAPEIVPGTEDYKRAVEEYLEVVVMQYDYKSWLSACAYASTENQYQEQSKRVVAWTAEVWSRFYEKTANTELKETIKEFVADLPKFGG